MKVKVLQSMQNEGYRIIAYQNFMPRLSKVPKGTTRMLGVYARAFFPGFCDGAKAVRMCFVCLE